MYGTVETVEERLEHLFRLRDASGRDRRLHGVHHVELSAAAHRAGRHGSDGRRVSADARDRAARARQLRQPAGLVGHAGREGRPAEPRVRRQRHGQRDDRGERRPRRRRRVLHGRVRGRAQHRERGLRRQAPQHALRHPRRPDLPRARACRACSSWPSRDRTAAPAKPTICATTRRAAPQDVARARVRRARRSTLERTSEPRGTPGTPEPWEPQGTRCQCPPSAFAQSGCCPSIVRRSTAAGSRSAGGRIVRVGSGRAPAAARGSRRRRRPARSRQRAHASSS